MFVVAVAGHRTGLPMFSVSALWCLAWCWHGRVARPVAEGKCEPGASWRELPGMGTLPGTWPWSSPERQREGMKGCFHQSDSAQDTWFGAYS